MLMYVYADNAATTSLSAKALEAMMPYFTEHFGNPSSIYPLGQDASDAVAEARAAQIRTLGIYFEEGELGDTGWFEEMFGYKDTVCCPLSEVDGSLSKIFRAFSRS